MAALGDTSDLQARLVDLIKRQKEVADSMHAVLTSPDGLCEDTRVCIKSLEAAVVVSRQPGYIRYHRPTERVAKLESGRELEKLAAQLAALEREIAQVNEEIAKRCDAASKKHEGEPPAETLAVWLGAHGRADPTFGGEGFTTTFVPNPKVYGGSKHYGGFKTMATTMKPGRLTT